HGGLASMLDRRIGNFVEEHDLGYTTTAEAGYVLFQNPDPEGNDTVFAPDVGFIAAERLPDGLPDGYVPFAPDLAVEVVSPNDKAADVQQKIATYLKYGTRLIWVFYPKTQSVVVHTRDGAKTYTIDDTLDGGEVLPGFRLPLRDVFTGE
ncbi:MAG: Uma2 family endonuclease, partial [Anaerolineae bacterium]|nr:Uma2 family endonuclease [Anaerolineae bacterium]